VSAPQRVIGEGGQIGNGDLAEEQLRHWPAAQSALVVHSVFGPAAGEPPELAGGASVAGGVPRPGVVDVLQPHGDALVVMVDGEQVGEPQARW
jgi:hypothetical protein